MNLAREQDTGLAFPCRQGQGEHREKGCMLMPGTKAISCWHAIKHHWDQKERPGGRNWPEGRTLVPAMTLG